MVIIQTKFGRFSQISEMKYKTFLGPGEFWHNGNPQKNTITYTKSYFGGKKRPKVATL